MSRRTRALKAAMRETARRRRPRRGHPYRTATLYCGTTPIATLTDLEFVPGSEHDFDGTLPEIKAFSISVGDWAAFVYRRAAR